MIAPATVQAFAAVLIATADLYCVNLGAAGVPAADTTVVVPEVTALIVKSPAPELRKDIAVPTGKLYVASVGMLTVFADPLDVTTNT
jgi:hypothetical protein